MKCRGKTIRRHMHHDDPSWVCSNFPRYDGVLAGCSRCDDGALEPALENQLVNLSRDTFRCSACSSSTPVCATCGTDALLEKPGPPRPFPRLLELEKTSIRMPVHAEREPKGPRGGRQSPTGCNEILRPFRRRASASVFRSQSRVWSFCHGRGSAWVGGAQAACCLFG